MKKLFCATFEGLEAKVVSVEATLTKGLPSFNIVGMASQSISESKERVKSALLSNDFSFPPKRITINLSPSDLKKEGSQFDLGIALLIALNHEELKLDAYMVFGELGLDGSVKENALLFALILSLANQGCIEKAIVPFESLKKLSNIPNVSFFGVKHLNDAMTLLKEGEEGFTCKAATINHPSLHVKNAPYYFQDVYPFDFSEIRGQEIAKRAALISASGMHNLLLEGSPGSGKSMIAKRLRYILPPVSSQELLDIAKLESFDGREPEFTPLRPFRAPHHSSTAASIFGGGSHQAKIGEVGLAHKGILFFDELPHFSKTVLEALREPLEDRHIRISRVNSKIEYATDFLFVSAMNPCPCGNLLHSQLECRCSDLEVQRYKNRLSDPFLDRIDLYVQMQNVSPQDRSSVDSKSLHVRVKEAYTQQLQRGQKSLNGALEDSDIERFCHLNNETQAVLDQAISRFSLSFRSIKKIQKIARTIADIEQSDTITKTHLLEALSYRRR
ncbi:MAG: YifB family Mg chelatase-like AAA ATPase [Campylobacterota bacterium]|nr:YifB family Mg chelatase-like AAA ATPase [Campylobacterota bacterium]